MAAKLTSLTHNIEIQLYLVGESYTICSSLSRRPVWKLLDTPRTYTMNACMHTYIHIYIHTHVHRRLKANTGIMGPITFT